MCVLKTVRRQLLAWCLLIGVLVTAMLRKQAWLRAVEVQNSGLVRSGRHVSLCPCIYEGPADDMLYWYYYQGRIQVSTLYIIYCSTLCI